VKPNIETGSEPSAAPSETLDPKKIQRSNELLGMGATVGVVGVAGAVLLGATCPLCVVAAPALLGAGLVERLRAKRKHKGIEPTETRHS
jgi:hypothetical protein